jgi:hypothetical protein
VALSDWAELGAFLNILIITVVVAKGIYQVLIARPTTLSLNRLLRKRVPTTAQDCALQGVVNILAGAAWAAFFMPTVTRWTFDPVAAGPPRTDAFGVLAFLWPDLLALLFILSCVAVASRVKYTSLKDKVNVGSS